MPSSIICALLLFALASHFCFTNANTKAFIPSTSTKIKRISTKLIHGDSIFHANGTVSERAERALNSSIARFFDISARLSGSNDLIESGILSGKANVLFYLRFGIGSPAITQLAVMDTGSYILWVKCLPCTNCARNSKAIFDPAKSSTYQTQQCSGICDLSYCHEPHECPDSISYVSGVGVSGVLASEYLTFDTSDDGEIQINTTMFLCGREMTEDVEEFQGVFGLSLGPRSTIATLGNKFAYCLGNVMDPEYAYNRFFLGESAIMQGDSTPFIITQGVFYTVTIEGISMGSEMLEIDSKIFEYGTIIDSGASYSSLVPNAYEVLRENVEFLLEGLEKTNRRGDDLCYEGDVEKHLIGFPVITFHFAGGAELVLDPGSLFVQFQSNLFCMAVISSTAQVSLLGLMAQQNYYVGYDLEPKKLYFQRIDCEFLLD